MTCHIQAQHGIQVARSLRGLHCRELPDDPKLLEVAAQGHCTQCKVVGFFNHQRIMKPGGYNKYLKEGVVGEVHLWQGDLKPRLTPAGKEPGSMLCPTCHLQWLDPITFAKEN